MDVGVLCSQTETFSNALLEIMASGIPVVAPSVGAIPEIIDNEQTGLLVPQGDADALAAAVIRLLTSKVETLQYVKRARSAVTQKYSMDVMISKVEGVLDAF